MADQQTTTLRQVLTQFKPRIPCAAPITKNTKVKEPPDINDRIELWHEFNRANLDQAYGHVLDAQVPAFEITAPSVDQMLAGRQISTFEDVKHLIAWQARLMEGVLQFSKARLGLHPGTMLKHDHSTPDQLHYARLPNAPGRQIVDHTISLDDIPVQNLIVGIGKPSSSWSGTGLACSLQGLGAAPSINTLAPLRQLAKLCQFAGTRYGYIVTDEALVVCQFARDGANAWKAFIMPIHWTKYGTKVLTTNLALWWLSMMAMSDEGNRAIKQVGELVSLGKWDLVCTDGDDPNKPWEWSLQHRFSKRTKPQRMVVDEEDFQLLLDNLEAD
ncbi:hypothetical protein QQX98_006113 [Neonectria punicea]|uniref:Uncharacterized protein n=1 Tax=Neonectria punicea TaxID=979145 RepID=A0ABR1H244_9HYPO